MFMTAVVILLLCAAACLLAHVVKPAVPLWPAILFVLVAVLVSVLPK